jgi:hypothetical protein
MFKFSTYIPFFFFRKMFYSKVRHVRLANQLVIVEIVCVFALLGICVKSNELKWHSSLPLDNIII